MKGRALVWARYASPVRPRGLVAASTRWWTPFENVANRTPDSAVPQRQARDRLSTDPRIAGGPMVHPHAHESIQSVTRRTVRDPISSKPLTPCHITEELKGPACGHAAALTKRLHCQTSQGHQRNVRHAAEQAHAPHQGHWDRFLAPAAGRGPRGEKSSERCVHPCAYRRREVKGRKARHLLIPG